MKKINQKGFTLIELLVVIAIIGLLSTMAVVSLNNARIKARDARRVSDIKQIQTALEMFFTDKNDYPAGASTAAAMTLLEDAGYMAAVPTNPTPNGSAYTYEVCNSDGTCCGSNTAVTSGFRSSYTLSYQLEQGAGGGMLEGYHCATPAGIDTGATATAITAVGSAICLSTDDATTPATPSSTVCP